MNIALTILIAVLAFGFLIFIHEFGHYFFARLFRVSIKEFSIGMGPKLVYWDSKKTGIRYGIGMFPIGGYVAMVGENDGSEDPDAADDPNAFDKKPAWQRFIITAAGAAVNILAGFLAMILVVSLTARIGGTTVHSFLNEEERAEYGYTVSTEDSGLKAGDKILAVDGKRVTVIEELSYEIMRRGIEPIDVTVLRDGEKIVLHDVVFPTEEADGEKFGAFDFRVYAVEKNVGSVLSTSFKKSVMTVRMCWESLFDLIRGRYSVKAVSGPVGVTSAIGQAASYGFVNLLNMIVLISINLGVMNLLPIPALDGGRLITVLFEMITKKRLPPKVEGIINGVGLIVLLLLSFVIMIKDILQLIL